MRPDSMMELPLEPAKDSWTDGAPERVPGENFVVDLDGFEGPLDLLLALARTQKVDLARISVAALADQYLAYIAHLRTLRLEIAADYLVMAAWLAYLKSRLLLPPPESPDDTPSADELAAALAARIRRLEAIRALAARLASRERLGRDVFARGEPEEIADVKRPLYQASLPDLLSALAEQRKRTVPHLAHQVAARKVWSLVEAREILVRMIGRVAEWTPLDVFLSPYLMLPGMGRTVLASAFGASLELVREGKLEIRQLGPFAPINLRDRVRAA